MNSHTGAAEVVAVAVVETSVLVDANSVVVGSSVAVEVNKVEESPAVVEASFTKNELKSVMASKRRIEKRVDDDSQKHFRGSAGFNSPS